MDWSAVIVLLGFFIPVMIGIPISYSLVLGSLIPLAILTNINLVAVAQKLFVGVDLFAFMAIPLFIFCGGLLEKSGVSRRLCDFVNSLVGWLPGGVAVVTFVTCMFFGAISGSATATVLAIGSIMVPIMIDQKYNEKFALAVIAIAGVLGSIIPPSIPMVVYGMNAGVDIGTLFLGGIGPGVLLTALFSVYAFFYGKKHPTTHTPFVPRVVLKTFFSAIWGLLMPLIILGGIYGGIFTPTEAAAVASVYGMIVGFLIYRELTLEKFYQCIKDSVVSSAMIMFIVAAATAFSYVLTREQIPNQLAVMLTSVTDSHAIFMLLVIAILLIMGCFMETCASILIVTPMVLPICKALNVNMVAFGVIMVVTLAIGFVTPPFGLNLYVAARLRQTSVDVVINKHLAILIGIAIGLVLIITFIPQVVMFIPNMLSY
jgi:C4-dicarboxylate transporter DctM subunit